jgi:hypothetical protein
MSRLTSPDEAPPPAEADEDGATGAARPVEAIGDVSDDEIVPDEGKRSPLGPLVT